MDCFFRFGAWSCFVLAFYSCLGALFFCRPLCLPPGLRRNLILAFQLSLLVFFTSFTDSSQLCVLRCSFIVSSFRRFYLPCCSAIPCLLLLFIFLSVRHAFLLYYFRSFVIDVVPRLFLASFFSCVFSVAVRFFFLALWISVLLFASTFHDGFPVFLVFLRLSFLAPDWILLIRSSMVCCLTSLWCFLSLFQFCSSLSVILLFFQIASFPRRAVTAQHLVGSSIHLMANRLIDVRLC